VICTGNVCRSPFAALVLARELDRRGVANRVSSAGLVGDGMPAAPEIIELLDAEGLDGRSHRSRLLSAEILAGADLVVGMAREHVREAVLAEPGLIDRAFTLKELVRRGRHVGPRPADEPLAGWLTRAGAGRRPVDTLGSSRDDDITDPIGRRQAVFRQVGDEITGLTVALAELAWPHAPGEAAPTDPSAAIG
jgi:protein-tyrosine phosphatase